MKYKWMACPRGYNVDDGDGDDNDDDDDDDDA